MHGLANFKFKMCEVFMAVKIKTVVLVLWLCCVADNNHPLIHTLMQHQWLQGLPNAAQLSQSTWLQESPTDPYADTIQMTTGINNWPTYCHNPYDYRNHLLIHKLSQFRWLQVSPTDPHAFTIQLTTGIIYWSACCHNSDDYMNKLLTHMLSQSSWLQE